METGSEAGFCTDSLTHREPQGSRAKDPVYPQTSNGGLEWGLKYGRVLGVWVPVWVTPYLKWQTGAGATLDFDAGSLPDLR